MDEYEDDGTESDNSRSTERSEASYRLVEAPQDTEIPSTVGLWIPIHNKITSLQQISTTIDLYRSRDLRNEVRDFMRTAEISPRVTNWKHAAFDAALKSFPNVSVTLLHRIMDSMVVRMARSVYLQRHKSEAYTQEMVDSLMWSPLVEEPRAKQRSTKAKEVKKRSRLRPVLAGSSRTSSSSRKLSITRPSEMRPRIRTARSPSKVTSTIELPRPPPLNTSGSGFDCSFCHTTCPAVDVSTSSLWERHLLQDLEPFFCVLEPCDVPLDNAGSYSAWLTHIQTSHKAKTWYCWYCQSDYLQGEIFSSPAALEDHLEWVHDDKVDASLRHVVVRHSVCTDRPVLSQCPFCVAYPKDIDASFSDRTSSDAINALNKHIKDHFIEIALMSIDMDESEDKG